MALGVEQRKILAEYAGKYKNDPVVRLQVNILPERSPTRELGSGMAITLTPYECYEEGDYKMGGVWIANCHYDHTAEEKGKEICLYLVAQGYPKERLRLRRGFPQKEIKSPLNTKG